MATLENTARRGVAGGYASLGADGKVPSAQLPSGQGGGDLLSTNNLSDVANAATARTNLGAAAAAHTHAQSDVTSLVADLALKAPLASPALTGTPAAPTASGGTNTTQLATTEFVQSAVAAHEAAGNPHPTYLTAAEGDAAYAAAGHTHSALPPVGGTTGQVLAKASNTNYDFTWSTPSGGSASLDDPLALQALL